MIKTMKNSPKRSSLIFFWFIQYFAWEQLIFFPDDGSSELI